MLPSYSVLSHIRVHTGLLIILQQRALHHGIVSRLLREFSEQSVRSSTRTTTPLVILAHQENFASLFTLDKYVQSCFLVLSNFFGEGALCNHTMLPVDSNLNFSVRGLSLLAALIACRGHSAESDDVP